MGVVPDLRSKEWKFLDINGGSTDLCSIEALQPRELLSLDQAMVLNRFVKYNFEKMGKTLGCTNMAEHHIVLLTNV